MNVRVRLGKTSDGKFIVQQKIFFWWKTLMQFNDVLAARDYAVMIIRGNGTIICESTKPAIAVLEYFKGM